MYVGQTQRSIKIKFKEHVVQYAFENKQSKGYIVTWFWIYVFWIIVSFYIPMSITLLGLVQFKRRHTLHDNLIMMYEISKSIVIYNTHMTYLLLLFFLLY